MDYVRETFLSSATILSLGIYLGKPSSMLSPLYFASNFVAGAPTWVWTKCTLTSGRHTHTHTFLKFASSDSCVSMHKLNPSPVSKFLQACSGKININSFVHFPYVDLIILNVLGNSHASDAQC